MHSVLSNLSTKVMIQLRRKARSALADSFDLHLITTSQLSYESRFLKVLMDGGDKKMLQRKKMNRNSRVGASIGDWLNH
ncbi:hypothetical protein YC2023_122913 [Brassica napus]